ncbi:MAG: YicC/YloC family endoribonuclease [Chthoniobacterales bacterium]
MKSMTGYGRGESPADNPFCIVECTSVNRKTLEVSCQLPRELTACEIPIRDVVGKRVSRGRVNVAVTLSGPVADAQPQLDFVLARQVARDLARMKAEMALSGSLDVATLLKVPGIIRSVRPPQDDLLPVVINALNAALDGLCAMREKEGASLAQDLRTRIAGLKKTVCDVAALAPQITAHYRVALAARLDAAKLEVPIDESRIAAEVVLFAERSDVTEEVTRLTSHLDQFSEKLAAAEPSGRALEFLCQEMSRELNTLGAKAGDPNLSRIVVDARVELDKIREQILNLE